MLHVRAVPCLVAAAALIAPVEAGAAVSPREASRFLTQATLGADWEEIERVSRIGYEDWLEDQFARPIGYHEPDLLRRAGIGEDVGASERRWSWWEQVIEGPDPLRQRVALALSEIFVVSDAVSTIRGEPIGLANYYDTLLEHSFGNYRDLLRDVTLHPIMGAYLSHLRNRRSDPSRGRFPDENYAREIMQLFSIGLFELRTDGTLAVDGTGAPIPTYDNDDITEFAKIFTGLAFASPDPDFRRGTPVWNRPMRMYDAYHEPGAKRLLRGRYVPPGQTGMQDIDAAIDNLFEHPNVGPFIGRRLIQRLVTSNPSPEYVGRVAAAFDDDGRGVRGNLEAVVRAILLDPEARAWPNRAEVSNGRLRESFLRRVHLARAFNASSLAREFPIEDSNAPNDFGQRPLSSPTVFNFFLPDYRPDGPIADAALTAPEFQVINSITAIASANALRTQIDRAMNFESDDTFEVRLDLTDEIALAANAAALVDRLDLLLTYGHMSARTRQIVIDAVERLSDPVERTRLAVYLVVLSPEYAIVK